MSLQQLNDIIRSRNELKIFEETKKQDESTHHAANNYSDKYRVFKTVFLVFAWISYGINSETTRISLEDLKILLNTNYYYISFVMIMRNVGFLFTTLFVGILIDRWLKYSDLFMAFAKLLMITANFFIPITKTYWLAMVLFFVQGVGAAIYDIGGNQIILRLWTGLSSSPINGMHSGYGIGAIIAVQLLKPFIRFDPLKAYLIKNKDFINHSTTTNYTVNEWTTADDIQLSVPYWLGCLFGLFLLICFIIAQYFEARNSRKLVEKKKDKMLLKFSANNLSIVKASTRIKCVFMQSLLFKDIRYQANAVIIAYTQIILLFMVFVAVMAFWNVQSIFMLTFLTKGPAKFDVDTYVKLQTAIWLFFILGRLLATFLAYKLNPFLFYSSLLFSTFVCLLLFCMPYLNSSQLFCWIVLNTLALFAGPLVPSGFMIARQVLTSINSYLISFFSIGLIMGAIMSQYVAAHLLDTLKLPTNWLNYTNVTSSVYIIPYISIFSLSIGILFFTLVFIISNRYRKYLQINTLEMES